MSINQYSSDIPETPWWRSTQRQQQQQGILMEASIQNSSTCGPPIHPSWPTQAQLYHQQPCLVNRGFNLNQDEEEEGEEEEEEAEEEEQGGSSSQVENGSCSRSGGGEGREEEEEEKEGMFEKSLTPSDVGKLNRLVIPKQHAEKYFPLSDSGENKGVLLSFEDESGKCWRFRYSYWNSSQSYVLTKGWSRYVKDKRLHAGDVVSFHRLRSLPHRLFITWRRCPHHQLSTRAMAVGAHATASTSNTNNTKGEGVGVGWTTTAFYSAHPYPMHQPFPFPPQTLHASGRGDQSEKQITRRVGNSSKVLRLFGVNMECQGEADDSGPQYSTHMMSSSTTHHHFYQYHHPQPSYPSNPHHHMDVNQIGNRPGKRFWM